MFRTSDRPTRLDGYTSHSKVSTHIYPTYIKEHACPISSEIFLNKDEIFTCIAKKEILEDSLCFVL